MVRHLTTALVGLVINLSASASNRWPDVEKLHLEVENRRPAFPTEVVAMAADGESLWVAGFEDLWRSGDGGRHWSRVSLPRSGRPIGIGLVKQTGALRVVTASGWWLSSTDDGQSWTGSSLFKLWDRAIPGLRPDDASWRTLDRAEFSPDLQHVLAIGYCEALLSHDGGMSWERIGGNRVLGGWDDDDRCLTDVVLDDQFEPTYASVEVTGRFASGAFVFRRTETAWEELCSFGTAGLLLQSVDYCADLSGIPQPQRLASHSDGLYAPGLENDDIGEAIFERGSKVLPEHTEPDVWPFLMQDGPTHWYVDYRGVARTEDSGESWSTLIGGMEIPDERLALADGMVSRADDKLYVSADDHIWRWVPVGADIGVSDIALVDGRVIVAHNPDGIFAMDSVDRTPEKRHTEGHHRLFADGGTVWALGSAMLSASDDGLRWFSSVDEVRGDGWTCLKHCVQFDYEGRKWTASRQEEEVVIERQEAGLPMDDPDYYLGGQWIGEDMSWFALQSHHDDSKPSRLHLSVNGQAWNTIALRGEDGIEHVVDFGNGRVLLLDSKNLYRFDSVTGEIETSVLPTDAGIYDACVVGENFVILETYGEHPYWPGGERGFVVFSRDEGATWKVTSQEYWCPD